MPPRSAPTPRSAGPRIERSSAPELHPRLPPGQLPLAHADGLPQDFKAEQHAVLSRFQPA